MSKSVNISHNLGAYARTHAHALNGGVGGIAVSAKRPLLFSDEAHRIDQHCTRVQHIVLLLLISENPLGWFDHAQIRLAYAYTYMLLQLN